MHSLLTLFLPYLYGLKYLHCLVPSDFFLLEIDWEYEHRCILTYINFISIPLYDRRKYRNQESGVNVSFQGSFSHFVLSQKNNTRGLDRSFVQLLRVSKPSFLEFCHLLLFLLGLGKVWWQISSYRSKI